MPTTTPPRSLRAAQAAQARAAFALDAICDAWIRAGRPAGLPSGAAYQAAVEALAEACRQVRSFRAAERQVAA